MNESSNPSAIRSKQEITEAMLRLMETESYNDITVKQIVLEAGVVRKTFYRNFDSKEDLLDAIINSVMDDYIKELFYTSYKSVPEVLVKFCISHKRVIQLLDKNNLMYLVVNKINEYILRRHKEIELSGMVPDTFFKGLDVKYIIMFNVGAIWNVVCAWVHGGMKDDPKEIVETLTIYLARIGQYAEKTMKNKGKWYTKNKDVYIIVICVV